MTQYEIEFIDVGYEMASTPLEYTVEIEEAFRGPAGADSPGGGGGGLTAEEIQDLVAAMFPDGTNFDWTYNDATGVITVVLTGVTAAQITETAGLKVMTAAERTAIANNTAALANMLTLPFVSKNADFTLTDANYTVSFDASGGARTATLPTAVGRTGKIFVVRKSDSSANTVIVDPNGAELVNGQATYVLTDQYETVTLQADGAGWIVL